MAADQIDDAGFFVRQHYLDFLERPADGPDGECGGDGNRISLGLLEQLGVLPRALSLRPLSLLSRLR